MLHFFKPLLLTVALANSLPLLAANPQPYASIRSITAVPYYLDDAYVLLNQIQTNSASVFVDVGSHDGAAARYIAQNSPAGFQVYSVDLWHGADAHDNAFQRFLSNVVAENTATTIVPLRMGSLEAAKATNILADVIFLGSCEPGLQQEILAWSSHLTANGVISGLNWTNTDVQVAVTQAAQQLGLIVHVNDNFWSLERS